MKNGCSETLYSYFFASMTYLLQLENQYQRFEGNPLKGGRFGDWHTLVDTAGYNTLLVNESYFDYYTYTIALTSPSPFSVKDMKELLQQKLKRVREKYGRVEILYHYMIDKCMQESAPVHHVLGKTGNLSFVLRVLVLQHTHALEAKKHLPVSQIKVIPKHLGLIQRLDKEMNGPYTLLNVGECEIVCIRSHGGWFTDVSVMPFGLSLLRECFKEHDIAPYLYNDLERLEKNLLLRKTIEEVFTFFLKQLTAWMHQYGLFGNPCVLVCQFSTHPLFLEVIETLSASYHSTVFIPFSGQLIHEDTNDTSLLLVRSWDKRSLYQKKKQ